MISKGQSLVAVGDKLPLGNLGNLVVGRSADAADAAGATLQEDIRTMVNAMGQCFGYLAQSAAQAQEDGG